MKAAAWIDRIKTAKGWDSDYRVAKELGTSRAVVSKYRGPTQTMDEEMSIKVALALDVDPIIILADQAMERAKSEPAKKAWSTALEKLGGASLCIM